LFSSELFCAALCTTAVLRLGLDLGLLFICFLPFCSVYNFAFVMLGLVSSLLSQEIGWEEAEERL